MSKGRQPWDDGVRGSGAAAFLCGGCDVPEKSGASPSCSWLVSGLFSDATKPWSSASALTAVRLGEDMRSVPEPSAVL